MTDRVFVIGAGRVGRGLALALKRAAGAAGAAGATGTSSAVEVIGVHARTPRPGATSAGAYPGRMGDASVVLVAVPDGAVDEVLRSLLPGRLARGARLEHGTVVLHTAGSPAPQAFDELRAAGLWCGVFHPLVPFATPERGAEQLRDGWIGVEGDPSAVAAGRRLAAAVGARTVTIPAGARALYHAAAVLASNFPVVLAALAARTLAGAGVDAQTAEQVVQQLMLGAAQNLAAGPPAAVLTGPVARGDLGTVEAHREALRGDPLTAAVYDCLTLAAEDVAGQRGRAPLG